MTVYQNNSSTDERGPVSEDETGYTSQDSPSERAFLCWIQSEKWLAALRSTNNSSVLPFEIQGNWEM